MTEAEEEQVEEASEGCGRGRRAVLLGLIGVGVSGRSRLVTSLSAAAIRGRLVTPDLGLDCSRRAGDPCGVAVALGFICWER